MTRFFRILALAVLALGPARFAAADSLFLEATVGGQTFGPGTTAPVTAGQAVTITEFYTNTGANSTASNSVSGQAHTDIIIGSFDTGIQWDTSNANFTGSGFALGSAFASDFAGPSVTFNPGQIHVAASGTNGVDVGLNQTVELMQFTLTASASYNGSTISVNMVNPLGSTPTDIADINFNTLTLNPAISKTNTYAPAYDVQLGSAGPAVPEPASMVMLGIAGAGLFFNRRTLRKLVG